MKVDIRELMCGFAGKVNPGMSSFYFNKVPLGMQAAFVQKFELKNINNGGDERYGDDKP